jgi:hypothetical protein
MPKPKSNKKVKSINFDIEVLEALEIKCRKERTDVSAFVNSVIKKCVISEYEYYRQLTKLHASEMHKYKTLMETAVDKPNLN